MGRKPRVDRTPEEKWQIVQEGMKSGNVSETCRRHGIAQNLYYRWKDEAEQGAITKEVRASGAHSTPGGVLDRVNSRADYGNLPLIFEVLNAPRLLDIDLLDVPGTSVDLGSAKSTRYFKPMCSTKRAEHNRSSSAPHSTGCPQRFRRASVHGGKASRNDRQDGNRQSLVECGAVGRTSKGIRDYPLSATS